MFLAETPPFALGVAEKNDYLLEQLVELTEYHAQRCAPYAQVVDDWRAGRRDEPRRVDDLPFLPVSVFKEFELRSANGEAMELNSSATTSGTSSRVFADKATRKRQSLSANRIWTDFVGDRRRPYVVFDDEATVRGTGAMSARGAAILSLIHLASSVHFVMKSDDDRLQLDDDRFQEAMQAVDGQPFLAYGFTYILHQAHQQLAAAGLTPREASPESVFLHSGGWKRMRQLQVSKPDYNHAIASAWGIDARQVVDFYGVVEQVGVFYPDCSQGLKHAPYWAEVVIREPDTLRPVPVDGQGLIQLANCLPLSGPNHCVLTEDVGQLALADGCACGRRGRAFRFIGRAPRAEVRGCSDVARR